MSAAEESAKLCPRCRRPLDPFAFASGQAFACSHCGAKVQRNPAAEFQFAAASEPVVAEADDWLADLQSLLVRMLIGIFQFIFVKLPSDIFQTVRRWFPTVVRLAIVVFLACLWLLAAFGPLAYSFCREGREPTWTDTPLPVPKFYLEYATVFDHGIAAYTILAIYGSFWKALQGVRRLRQKRGAAGKR